MPEILDPLTKMQAEALRALAGVLWAGFALMLAHKFIPVLVEKFRGATAPDLTVRDVTSAANTPTSGKLMVKLADSVEFQAIVDNRVQHKLNNTQQILTPRIAKLEDWRDRHDAEDRQVHQRVTTLEVEYKELQADVREIKTGMERLTEKIETKSAEMMEAIHALELRSFEAVQTLKEYLRK